MVRTRATTAPTPIPARQEMSKPATGAVARRGTVARGRGRGRGSTSSRGRGQAPSPPGTRAVNPLPTRGSDKRGGLSDQGQTPPVFSAPAPQVPEVQYAATVAPCMDASLEIDTFPRLTTGPIMTNDQHELF
ncbi:hypothetical protein EJD97_024218, partial [Solanum chilense]